MSIMNTRFRLDSLGGLSADAAGGESEVEDYRITITAAVPAPIPLALMGIGLAGISCQRRKPFHEQLYQPRFGGVSYVRKWPIATRKRALYWSP